MLDVVAELAEVLPPPPGRERTLVDWGPIESELGLRLPEDYKQFVEIWGPGAINDELIPFSPFGKRPYHIVTAALECLEFDREEVQHFLRPFPYRFFPESPGLFPWAVTGNGHYLDWLVVDGETGLDVPVVVKATGSGEQLVWQYEGGTCRFLTDVLTGRIDNEILPLDWYLPPRFTSDVAARGS